MDKVLFIDITEDISNDDVSHEYQTREAHTLVPSCIVLLQNRTTMGKYLAYVWNPNYRSECLSYLTHSNRPLTLTFML